MKPSFTILELVIVIIIIGILASTISIYIPNDNLRLAADNLAKNIRFTESLALKDDKYQPFPIENNSTEYNRSKYWFKQWWQIRFSSFNDNGQTHYWYEIFSDQPYDSPHSTNDNDNFDKVAKDPKSLRNISIAKNPLNNKLMIGHCDNGTNFPTCDKIDSKLDLTLSYNIKKIEFVNFDINTKRLVFDNFGNVFLKESISHSDRNGDVGDINPVDKNSRKILRKKAAIKLCLDNPCNSQKDRCIQINITPTGYVFVSECD